MAEMANTTNISIRPAEPGDLDAITAVALAALPKDPAWPYRYPDAELFPADHQKYSRIRYSEYLDNVAVGAYAVTLAELPGNEAPDTRVIVGISMWQLPGTHGASQNGPTEIQRAMKPPGDYSDRRDASSARMNAFRASIKQNKKDYFDSVYGEEQLSLMVLATHPDYQRRGVGSALVTWGIQKAKIEGLTVTLFSSPQGYGLYRKLGFRDVGRARVQVDGEEEFLEFPVMLFETRQEPITGLGEFQWGSLGTPLPGYTTCDSTTIPAFAIPSAS